MAKNPSEGERAARIGYEAQDKRAANLIYDFLLEGRLESYRIADPNAGRVDDIQISTVDGELHAYQVKWSETTQTISFSEFTSESGATPCLISQLSDGWRRLQAIHPHIRVSVHLITRHIPLPASTKAKIPLDTAPPPEPHFQAFVRDCWKHKNDWIDSGIAGIPKGWNAAMSTIQKVTGLTDDKDFIDFISALCSRLLSGLTKLTN